jgi:type I restriction enzyme, S subunit
MIEGLKPYPAMKDSGVTWLANVPEHWELCPLSRVLMQRKEKNDPIKTTNILSLSLKAGVIPYAEKEAGGNKAKEDISAYMLAYPGDIVINSMNVVVGSVGLSKYFGAVSPVYYMLRPRVPRDVVEYFSAVFSDRAFQRSLFGLGNGIMFIESRSTGKLNTIRLRIPMTRLKRVTMQRPPSAEQAAIVRFLDHADARTRRYIAAKQKLIKLLEEEKQAIIHRAVTRGLDPNVRLKPSGVKWLGDVPEHWELKRAKYYFHEVDERSVDGSEELMSVSHKTGVTSRSEKNITMFMAESYVGHKLCRPGDIAVNTMWAWMAAVGVAKKLGLVSPSYGVYRPHSESDFRPAYLDFLLRIEAYRHEYVTRSRGITTSRLRLYPDDFLRVLFVRPPLAEQDEILFAVQHETAELEQAIETASREIALLREYRASLISDVVTGKLDVREAAAKLPEAESEIEPLDEIDDQSQDEELAEAIDLEAVDAA